MADDIFKGSTVTTESAADDVFRGALVHTTPVADDIFRGRLATTTQPAGDVFGGQIVTDSVHADDVFRGQVLDGLVPTPAAVWGYDPASLFDVDYEFQGGVGRAWINGVLYESIAAAYTAGALIQDATNGDAVLLPSAVTEIDYVATGVNVSPAAGTGITQYLMSVDDNGLGTATDNIAYCGEQNPSGTTQLRQSASSSTGSPTGNYSSLLANAPTTRGVIAQFAGRLKSGANRWFYNGRYNASDSVANFPGNMRLFRFGNGLSNTRKWLGSLLRFRAWGTTVADDTLLGMSALRPDRFLNCAYSWWIKDQCEIRNGVMYFTGAGLIGTNAVGAAGRQFMAAVDLTTGLLVGYKTLYTSYIRDDHDAPGFKFLDNGGLLVSYPPHNDDGVIRARYSADGTVNNLGSEFTLATYTEASYVQLQEFGSRVLHFVRDTVNAWAVTRSDDYGQSGTWTKMRTLLNSGLQFYCNAMKVDEDLIRVFTYNHPETGDNVIKMLEITPSTGAVVTGSGTLGDLYDTGAGTPVAAFSAVSTIFAPAAGSCVRLLDISDDGNTLLLWETVNGQYGSGVYKIAIYNGGDRFASSGWTVKTTIGAAGASFANPATTYIGGMCFDRSPGSGLRIYVSQEAGGTWTIKKMTSADNGDTWSSVTLATSAKKLIRPASPIGATAKRPVIWQECDIYNTYTDFFMDTVWPTV